MLSIRSLTFAFESIDTKNIVNLKRKWFQSQFKDQQDSR